MKKIILSVFFLFSVFFGAVTQGSPEEQQKKIDREFKKIYTVLADIDEKYGFGKDDKYGLGQDDEWKSKQSKKKQKKKTSFPSYKYCHLFLNLLSDIKKRGINIVLRESSRDKWIVGKLDKELRTAAGHCKIDIVENLIKKLMFYIPIDELEKASSSQSEKIIRIVIVLIKSLKFIENKKLQKSFVAYSIQICLENVDKDGVMLILALVSLLKSLMSSNVFFTPNQKKDLVTTTFRLLKSNKLNKSKKKQVIERELLIKRLTKFSPNARGKLEKHKMIAKLH